MDTGDGTRQHALPARGMQGVNNEERIPPEQLCALNMCGHQGRERWGGSQQPVPVVSSQ